MSNYVFACHITGVYDVNRNQQLANDDFDIIQPWVDSLIKHQVKGIVFHNQLSAKTCALHSNEFVSFQQIEYDARFNPNVFRYLVYNHFLNTTVEEIEALFITDISDVVMLNHPFESDFFKSHPNALFCGDEPTLLANDWMQNHCTHLRNQISDFELFEKNYQQSTLLNCGIIGGHISIMKNVISQLSQLHELHNANNTTAYTGDMGAFNYLARTVYNNQLIHGKPVNTVFKSYEENSSDCWFRHK